MNIYAATLAPPGPLEGERQLHCLWRYEAWLARLHWVGLLGCLLLPLLFPGVSSLGALLLATSVALGNAGLLWILAQEPHIGRLRVARALATAIEWKTVLGIVALRANDPAANAPPLVLIPLLLTGARYGLRGLLVATAGASLAVGVLTTAQVALLRVLDAPDGRAALLGRVLLVWGMAAALGTLLAWQRREEVRQRQEAASSATDRLTEREEEVLALLIATEDERPPRKELARRLAVTENTVKTHMRHLARKLGAEDASREAILRAAHRGKSPTLPSPRSDDMG